MQKQKVALVLSGGGARGFAHIGAIEALQQSGFAISSVAGTSMGALVGGMYAMGEMETFKDWVISIRKWRLLQLVDFAYSREGLFKGEKLFKLIRKVFPETNIENLTIPFCAIATELNSYSVHSFEEGDIYAAIRASMAIPTVFTPAQYGDHAYVDGGVLNNIPIQYVKRNDGDIVVAIDVNAYIPFDGNNIEGVNENRIPRKDFYSIINQSVGLMIDRIAHQHLKEYPPDFLVKLSRESCGMFEFFRAKDQIEYGYRSSMAQLQPLKEKLAK